MVVLVVPRAPDEVRAALVMNRRRALSNCDFAYAVVRVLPVVHAEMLAGRVDRDRAWVFAQDLVDLPAELIAKVLDVLLPVAAGLTTGQLHARILKLILAADPERAREEYERAIAQRSVVGYLDADGTAVISASGLPADEAAAATGRIAELASAAKRAGHPGLIDQIRADIYLRLLDGRFHRLARAQMIAALLAEAAPERVTGEDETRGRVGGIEVRARLDTLAGVNELPGELSGWGPVLASVARRVAARQHAGEWRWVVTNDEGYLVAEGLTRRRPTTGPPDHRADGGIVELATPATVLARLVKDPPPEWAGVIADIAAQYQRARAGGPRAGLDAQPRRRFPGRALRRHVQVRDRTCTAPSCRRPAAQSDQDHTVDHQHGGATTSTNMAPACTHDHQLKHAGGWTVTQPRPGHFVWRSPLGRVYRTRGERITEPEPPRDPPGDPPPF